MACLGIVVSEYQDDRRYSATVVVVVVVVEAMSSQELPGASTQVDFSMIEEGSS